MAKLINGKEVSAAVKLRVKNQTEELIEKNGITPGLAVVIVGNDPASRVYVNSKKKACAEVGFNSYEYALPEETTQQELLELVEKLNNDPKVNGILCQLPLPKQIVSAPLTAMGSSPTAVRTEKRPPTSSGTTKLS